MAYIQNKNTNILHAIDVIEDTYGDVVSVDQKKKDLNKFGFTDQCQTTSTEIQRLPSGTYNETDIYRNLITTISSDNASDTIDVTIEGHTVGTDQSVTLTQTAGTATGTATTHGFSVGEWVYVNGANEAGYNGIVQVLTTPTADTYTYSVASGTASPATGTITVTSQNLTFVSQVVTLNGQTQVTLGTALARASRLSVHAQNRATSLVGSVYVYETDTSTAGVPDTASKVHMMNGINGAINNSLKGKTSISNTDYWLVTSFHGHYEEKSAGFASIVFQVREQGGVWREVDDITVSASMNTATIEFAPYIIIPKNADVRLVGACDVNGKEVGGSILGYLAKVI